MAGWKLRKDKSQAETAATEPQDAAPSGVEAAVPHDAEALPETEHTGPVFDLDSAPAHAGVYEAPPTLSPDFETESDLHFADDDGPLKLVDYTEPETQPIIAAPPPSETIVTEAAPEEPKSVLDTKDFTSTLRMNREELASAMTPPPSAGLPTGLPTVPPFVLDAPLVTDATEDTPPRLVVRVGRLSGAFELTKDVTTIGRPDSALHYYPDVEIDLDDAVSRRHAEVLRREDSYSIVDTGSTNGTLLNGEKLPPHEERLLAHGDRIRVGERTEIIFE